MESQVIRSLDTTKALTEQFILSLSSPPLESATSQETQSPLPLLSTSAEALNSQSAKVSLLAINSPFTPSAVIAVLSDLDGSVLPSLVTAALLIRSEYHTESFHSETNSLIKTTFRALQVLIDEVKVIALENGKDLKEEQKNTVITTTGRIWKSCEQLVTLSKEGILGLVVQKARQYLELVRDGIRELQEWDPAESGDDEDGFLNNDDGDDDTNDSSIKDVCNGVETDDGDDTLRYEEARDAKKEMLRILNPVAQIYPTIISHLLEGITEWSPSYVPRIEELVSCLQDIPDLTDEAVGSLYETNIKSAAEYVRKVLDRAIAAVTTTRDLLDGQVEYEKRTAVGDKFSKWASVWLSVAEEMRKSQSTPANNSASISTARP